MMPKKTVKDDDVALESGSAIDAAAEQGFDLDDDSRLPWLEPADSYDDEGAVSPTRLLAMVVGGLILIGAVLGGLWWVQNNGNSGSGELIAAQKGDYKVAPASDNAMDFEGEGDARFAASEGAEPTATIDISRVPEEPAVKTTPKAAPAVPPQAAPPAKAAVATGTGKAATSAAPAGAAVSGGSATIQLGAFSSAGSADRAWASLTKRFAYLSGLGKSVVPANVGGANVYRLRVGTASATQAGEICAKLKVAGENCAVIR